MKTRYKIMIIGIIAMFLIFATVIYPTMNYRTWGNNELSYQDGLGKEIICDEKLWQPPSNCRVVEDTGDD